jgi:hypothetical protein
MKTRGHTRELLTLPRAEPSLQSAFTASSPTCPAVARRTCRMVRREGFSNSRFTSSVLPADALLSELALFVSEEPSNSLLRNLSRKTARSTVRFRDPATELGSHAICKTIRALSHENATTPRLAALRAAHSHTEVGHVSRGPDDNFGARRPWTIADLGDSSDMGRANQAKDCFHPFDEARWWSRCPSLT